MAAARKCFNPVRTHSVALGQRLVLTFFSHGRVTQCSGRSWRVEVDHRVRDPARGFVATRLRGDRFFLSNASACLARRTPIGALRTSFIECDVRQKPSFADLAFASHDVPMAHGTMPEWLINDRSRMHESGHIAK
jgi:hypothetical protein